MDLSPCSRPKRYKNKIVNFLVLPEPPSSWETGLYITLNQNTDVGYDHHIRKALKE